MIANSPKISKLLLNDFVRGIFDGDGCLHIQQKIKRGSVSIMSTKIFCEQLREHLLQHKINSNVYGEKGIDNRVGRLRIEGARDVVRFGKFIYKSIDNQIFLKRKFDKFVELELLRR